MLVNIIQNTISSFRSALAAAEVITTNLKMWLGFETSETLGREEVTDGDFPTGTTAWDDVSESGGSITLGDGFLDITTGDSNLKEGWAQQILTLEIGKTYQIQLTNIGRLAVQVGHSNKGFQILYADITTDNTHTFLFTATHNTIYLNFRNFHNLNASSRLTNVSVKELTQITPDKSGNNNVGELFTGKALDFDGNGDYVDISGFSMSGNNATFAFWAYIRDNARADYFFDFHSTSTRFILGFGQASQKLAIYSNSGSGSWNDFGDPPQDQWVRIVLTVNGTTAKCFVDGVQLGTDKTISAYDFSSATIAHIGARYVPETVAKWYDGLLSDFQIYNSVWTTDDIAYDYANPNKLAIDNPSASVSVTNLKAYWALSEGDGLVAYDSGTNLEEEEVTNGDFATDSDWAKGTGISISNNAMNFTSQSGKYGSQSINIIDGVAYKINFEITTQTSGQLRIFLGANNTVGLVSGLGEKEIIASADTSIDTKIYFGDEFTGSISNVSVREVTASDHGGIINGADYVDAQPRIPQLGMMNWSKGSNLLTYSNDFTEWSNPSSIAITPNYGTSPIGTQDASRVVFTGSNQVLRLSFTTTTNLTASIYMKGSGTIKFGMNTGEEIQTLSTNWQRFIVSRTAGATSTTFNTYGGATARDIQVWGAQVEVGTSAGNYRLTDGGGTLNSTVIANPTIPTQDIFGNAVRDRLNSFNLNGSGYAEVANSTSLSISNGTLQFWLKTTDTDFTILQGALAKEYIGRTNNNAWSNGGTATISTFIDNAVSSSQPLYDNDWHFYTFTGIDINLWTGFSIGDETFDGLISDVLIYDGVLTSVEIQNNYNAGSSAHTND